MIPAADGILVQRLFERLLVAVGGNDHRGPITIGDLYQRLIPYRSVRSEIGVMELASYEHGLLRLLAAESGYLEVESETAAAEIGRELASPNPILGIYRDYADVPVRIVGVSSGAPGAVEPRTQSLPAAPTGGAAEGNSAPPSRTAVRETLPGAVPGTAKKAVETLREAARPADAGPLHTSGSPTAPNASAPDPTQETPSIAPALCTGCASALPAVPGMRFCPYCGKARGPSPCGRCGTPLEPDWHYCIRCGGPA